MDLYQKEMDFDPFEVNYDGKTYCFPGGVLAFNEKNYVYIKGRYTHPFLMEDDGLDQVISTNVKGYPIEILDSVKHLLRSGCTRKYLCKSLSNPVFKRFVKE